MRWPKLHLRALQLVNDPAPEPLLSFGSAPPPQPAPFAERCPCCGLRVSSTGEGGLVCAGECSACGGPCMGIPQREPAPPAAPPLAVRPVEDFNWTMRN